MLRLVAVPLEPDYLVTLKAVGVGHAGFMTKATPPRIFLLLLLLLLTVYPHQFVYRVTRYLDGQKSTIHRLHALTVGLTASLHLPKLKAQRHDES